MLDVQAFGFYNGYHKDFMKLEERIVAKINLQMYSFMDGTMNDSRENLRMAAKMGYSGVELFGPNFEIPVEEMKALLEELGLEPVSLHAPMTDAVPDLIPYAEGLGMKFIGIGMQLMMNDDEVHAFAKRLNELGEICHEHGLMLTYHNHTQEFAPCGDKKIIDVLLEETNPEYVSMELDAGWCAAAGFDPIEFVQQYSGRVQLIHIKESDKVLGALPPMDFSALPKDENGFPLFSDELKASMAEEKAINCPAGDGLVDWAALKQAADAHGCKHYIVERENTPAPYASRLEVLEADIKYYQSVL